MGGAWPDTTSGDDDNLKNNIKLIIDNYSINNNR
jgi:hypothetical protein